MRESSSANASIRQVQAEAKSLFGNILAVSPCRSIFCPDPGLSSNDKLFEISILAVEREKNGKRYIQSEPQAGGRAPYPKLRRIMGSKTLVVLIVSATICSAGMLTGQTQSAPEVVEKLGRGMSPPRVTYSPPPQYSEKARVAKYQATCILKLIVGADGNPRNIRVINPIGLGLDEKALEAVRSWKFQPALKDGKPVAVEIAVEVDFHLYGDPKIADLTARANAGDAQAQLDLAHAYLKGKDTAKDERMGLSYLEKSAKQGLPRAQFEMGEQIVHQAAPAEYPNDSLWYTLARRGGDKHSEKALKELSAKMTPEQIQAGQVLVDGWTNVPANNGSPK